MTGTKKRAGPGCGGPVSGINSVIGAATPLTEDKRFEPRILKRRA